MDNLKIVLLVPYVLSGLVISGLAVPLILGKVAPNAWYGFRVRRTLEDPKVWYPANRYAGWHLLALGALLLVTAVGLYFWPGVGFVAYAVICGGLMLGGVAVGVVRSFRYLGRLRP
jgi:hypothetical protein